MHTVYACAELSCHFSNDDIMSFVRDMTFACLVPRPLPAFQRFSACNIKKAGSGLGTRLDIYYSASMHASKPATSNILASSAQAMESLLYILVLRLAGILVLLLAGILVLHLRPRPALFGAGRDRKYESI